MSDQEYLSMDSRNSENSTLLPILANDITEKQIHNYNDFRKMVVPLSHLKVKRGAVMNYYHHYLVTNIFKTKSDTVVVTIVHYTSSPLILAGNIQAKVVIETYEIGENIENDLFDFHSGLFLIRSNSFYPKNGVDLDEAYKRIGTRLGGTEYHRNCNNCEHLVNYILTGKSTSEQFRRTDLCNSLKSNIKEIGITTALLVSALGAIAGSLVRRAYVRVMLAALISFEANIGLPVVDTCPKIIGQNIINEAKLRISEGTNLPNASAIPDLDNIIKNTSNKLSNTYVCEVAEYFAWHALWKVCVSSLSTSFGIETIIIANDTTETQIHNYNDFREMVVPLSHLKVKRDAVMNYYHHYLVTNICTTMSGTVVVTIVHYTSSPFILTENFQGVGKVVIETYEIGENIENDQFDFGKGLFLIRSNSFYPKNSVDVDEAYKRIGKRLGETEFHLNWNNCEHLVNYILTGKSRSKQVRRARRCTDLCNSLISNIKEIGITTALLVSSLGAIAGSLVRRAYVRVMLAALISFEANIGLPVVDTCPSIIGRNIIHEAKLRILEGTNLPNASAIPDLDNIIKNTSNKLSNTYVCEVAEYFAWQALWKVCVSSLITSFGLETIIIVCFVYFNLIPLRKIFLKNKKFCRIIFLRLFPGYISTVMAVTLGALGQLYLPRPVRAYFLIAFGSGLFFRYVLTIFAGFLYDSLSCECCWKCCPTCENIETQKIRSLSFIFVLVIIILCIMAIVVGFLLK